MQSNQKRTVVAARDGRERGRTRGRARRVGAALAAAGALSLLSGCILFNEFKGTGTLVEDDCFSVVAASFCIDFDTGTLEATGVVARVEPLPHCKPIQKIRISGWVDKNDNGSEDEGEAIDSTEHEVAEEEGSNHVTMGNVSLGLNAGSEDTGDVHLCVEVTRTGSDTTQKYPQAITKC